MEETKFEQTVQEVEATLREMWYHTDEEWFQDRIGSVSNAMDTLRGLYDDALEALAQFIETDEEKDMGEEEKECETADDVEAVEEAEGAPAEPSEKEEFELRLAQLAGLSEQFTALGRKRPESICGTFKAQQVNRVLLPLKERMEKDTGLTLSLVSEEGEQSYSDVSLLIQGFLDLCSHYAIRHYGQRCDMQGHALSSRGYGYGHR